MPGRNNDSNGSDSDVEVETIRSEEYEKDDEEDDEENDEDDEEDFYTIDSV